MVAIKQKGQVGNSQFKRGKKGQGKAWSRTRPKAKGRPESKMAPKRCRERSWKRQAAVRQRQGREGSERSAELAQGGFVHRSIKAHSSLHRHTQLREALLFSLVPAQAVVSVDLKPVPLPPKLKSFDEARWKQPGTWDYTLCDRKRPGKAHLGKRTARERQPRDARGGGRDCGEMGLELLPGWERSSQVVYGGGYLTKNWLTCTLQVGKLYSKWIITQ